MNNSRVTSITPHTVHYIELLTSSCESSCDGLRIVDRGIQKWRCVVMCPVGSWNATPASPLADFTESNTL